MRQARREATSFIAHVVPGLEEFAAHDLREHLGEIEAVRTLRRFDERTSLIVFRYSGPPRALLTLRSVEDVFALVTESARVSPDRHGLAVIRGSIERSDLVSPALTAASQVRERRARRATYRVIARVAGKHSYRRVDVQHTVERAIGERFPTWRLVEDNAQFEFWVHLVGGELIIGLRLSDITMRQRIGERVTLPASLKPTVAYAMVSYSRPQPDDVFLDPMCGTGTILIERAELARYRLLLGGDINPEAVRATRENIGPRFKPIEIDHWDARQLPLEADSVSVIVSNLPFGRQIGRLQEMPILYPSLLAEWQRVLAPGGRMVLLTSEQGVLKHALQEHPLRLEALFPVLVRGYPAQIHILRG